jgi:hypothetical protein
MLALSWPPNFATRAKLPCQTAMHWRRCQGPLEDVLGHQRDTFHPQWVNPLGLGSTKASWMKMSFFFSRAKARPIIFLSLPLMRSQQPSDGLFSPMEVRTNHLPMCTGPLGTCNRAWSCTSKTSPSMGSLVLGIIAMSIILHH